MAWVWERLMAGFEAGIKVGLGSQEHFHNHPQRCRGGEEVEDQREEFRINSAVEPDAGETTYGDDGEVGRDEGEGVGGDDAVEGDEGDELAGVDDEEVGEHGGHVVLLAQFHLQKQQGHEYAGGVGEGGEKGFEDADGDGGDSATGHLRGGASGEAVELHEDDAEADRADEEREDIVEDVLMVSEGDLHESQGEGAEDDADNCGGQELFEEWPVVVAWVAGDGADVADDEGGERDGQDTRAGGDDHGHEGCDDDADAAAKTCFAQADDEHRGTDDGDGQPRGDVGGIHVVSSSGEKEHEGKIAWGKIDNIRSTSEFA